MRTVSASLAPLTIVKQAHIDNTKNKKGGVGMETTVKEQILAIRDTGEVNMFDIRGVQRIANREGFYELATYLEEHRSEYTCFILTGRTTYTE